MLDPNPDQLRLGQNETSAGHRFNFYRSDRTSFNVSRRTIMHNAISKYRLDAFKRQQGRCHYCGLLMWLKHPKELVSRQKISGSTRSRLRCTAEHLVARQDGGTNSHANIVAACLHCNRTRHRMKSPPDPAKYRDRVRRRVRAGKWHPGRVRQLMVDSRYKGGNVIA